MFMCLFLFRDDLNDLNGSAEILIYLHFHIRQKTVTFNQLIILKYNAHRENVASKNLQFNCSLPAFTDWIFVVICRNYYKLWDHRRDLLDLLVGLNDYFIFIANHGFANLQISLKIKTIEKLPLSTIVSWKLYQSHPK